MKLGLHVVPCMYVLQSTLHCIMCEDAALHAYGCLFQRLKSSARGQSVQPSGRPYYIVGPFKRAAGCLAKNPILLFAK